MRLVYSSKDLDWEIELARLLLKILRILASCGRCWPGVVSSGLPLLQNEATVEVKVEEGGDLASMRFKTWSIDRPLTEFRFFFLILVASFDIEVLPIV